MASIEPPFATTCRSTALGSDSGVTADSTKLSPMKTTRLAPFFGLSIVCSVSRMPQLLSDGTCPTGTERSARAGHGGA